MENVINEIAGGQNKVPTYDNDLGIMANASAVMVSDLRKPVTTVQSRNAAGFTDCCPSCISHLCCVARRQVMHRQYAHWRQGIELDIRWETTKVTFLGAGFIGFPMKVQGGEDMASETVICEGKQNIGQEVPHYCNKRSSEGAKYSNHSHTHTYSGQQNHSNVWYIFIIS